VAEANQEVPHYYPVRTVPAVLRQVAATVVNAHLIVQKCWDCVKRAV